MLDIFAYSPKKIFYLLFAGILLTLLALDIWGYMFENFSRDLYSTISGKHKQHIIIDESNVPVVIYQGKLGKQYNPVTIAEYALRDLDMESKEDSAVFYSSISWLIRNNISLNDSTILFEIYYDWPGYEMKAPWRSAMAQGRAMQAFIKASRITGRNEYLDYAEKAMNALFIPVKEGGVTYFDSTGNWYEEYADDNVRESRVLNGMVVVLQALSDYQDVFKDSKSRMLFLKGVEAVKKLLPLYNNDGHSNYDILGKPATNWYHNFHITLLDFLYEKTGDVVFKSFSDLWKSYKVPSYLSYLYRKPTNIGLFTVVSVFAVIISGLTGIYLIWHRISGRVLKYGNNSIC